MLLMLLMLVMLFVLVVLATDTDTDLFRKRFDKLLLEFAVLFGTLLLDTLLFLLRNEWFKELKLLFRRLFKFKFDDELVE